MSTTSSTAPLSTEVVELYGQRRRRNRMSWSTILIICVASVVITVVGFFLYRRFCSRRRRMGRMPPPMGPPPGGPSAFPAQGPQGYPGSAPQGGHPGQPSGYPGQSGGYPGQSSGYPGQTGLSVQPGGGYPGQTGAYPYAAVAVTPQPITVTKFEAIGTQRRIERNPNDKESDKSQDIASVPCSTRLDAKLVSKDVENLCESGEKDISAELTRTAASKPAYPDPDTTARGSAVEGASPAEKMTQAQSYQEK